MKRLLLVLPLALALVACGSGGGSSGSSTTSTTYGLPKDPNEKALAQGGTLKLSDLPTGFVATPEDKDANDDFEAEMVKIPECARLKELVYGKANGSAESPDFEFGDDIEVSNEVEIFRDAAAVDPVMNVIPSATTVDCLRKAMETALNEGLAKDPATAARVRDISVTGGPITPGAFGDGTVGVGIRVAIDVGRPIDIAFDLVGVRVGRALVTYSFQDTQASPLGSLREHVIQTTVDRLRAA